MSEQHLHDPDLIATLEQASQRYFVNPTEQEDYMAWCRIKLWQTVETEPSHIVIECKHRALAEMNRGRSIDKLQRWQNRVVFNPSNPMPLGHFSWADMDWQQTQEEEEINSEFLDATSYNPFGDLVLRDLVQTALKRARFPLGWRVLRLRMEGYQSKEIAARLGVCSDTIHARMRLLRSIVRRMLQEKIPRKCKRCGGWFKPDRIDRQHCSDRCRTIVRSKRISKMCYGCGKPFFVLPHKENQKYHNRKCSLKYQAMLRKKHVPTSSCKICGKPLRWQRWNRPVVVCKGRCTGIYSRRSNQKGQKACETKLGS